MKIDGQRVIWSETAHPLTMQTKVMTFSIEEDEENLDVFGVKLSDIPKLPSPYQGGPEMISCKLTFILDMKADTITLELLKFGVDVYGDNPVAEVDNEKIGHRLPMKKIGFRKYEIDESALSEGYTRNAIVDALMLAAYKGAR
jgi:hypothetical protein